MKFLFVIYLFPVSLLAEVWSWKLSLSKSFLQTQTPTERMYARAVRDALEEEKIFFPELYFGNYLYPRQTKLEFDSYSVKTYLEYMLDLENKFYFGLEYFQTQLTSKSNNDLNQKKLISLIFTQNLDIENKIRAIGYINNSYLEMNPFYTVVIGYRYFLFPIEYPSLYTKVQIGAGSCVRGPTCNVARGEIGLGIEKKVQNDLSFYFEFFVSHFTQSQELIRFLVQELGSTIGIRLIK